MSKDQAEQAARKYLARVAKGGKGKASGEQYDRALRKATASISQLQEAVRLATRNGSGNGSG